MRLDSEFIRLPLSFDVDRLQAEALQFSEYDWDYHPQRYDGNTALNLVSRDGGRSNAYVGHMQATEALSRCPYIQQVMASFNTVIGRSRFMRLAPGKGVPAHSDTDYSWRHRVRIHIPIVTDPKIKFACKANPHQKGIEVHKQAGEAWIFDNWREHEVINDAEIQRIHLVIDTVGTSRFWQIAKRGWDARTPFEQWQESIKYIAYDQESLNPQLRFERYNRLIVRSPGELEQLIDDFMSEIDQLAHADVYSSLLTILSSLSQDWRGMWAEYLDSPDGLSKYQSLINSVKKEARSLLSKVFLISNGAAASQVLNNWLDNCIDLDGSHSNASSQSVTTTKYQGKIPKFEQPVLIVAAPRSGSTMLFEALKNNKDLWTIGDEAHQEIEGIKTLHPRFRGFDSNRLSAQDYSEQIGEQITHAFMGRLQNSRSAIYADMPLEFQPDTIRFLEKTPKNALRIPFFKTMFDDAKFVYLYREPKANIASMIEAWSSGRFVTYPDLPGWPEQSWSLLLIENWRELVGKSMVEIAAQQWAQTNLQIIDDLEQLARSEVFVQSYESLLSDTSLSMQSICEFMCIPYGPKMRSYAAQGFPNSKYAVTQPNKDKWRQHEEALAGVKEIYQPVLERIRAFERDQKV